MDSYIVKVLSVDFITHNVKRFVVEKPAGYTFIPGQATDVAINRPGLETELRPFTFTSHTDDDHLEFIIKIYTGHDGITEKLAAIHEGDELIIHEVFGAINYKGPGVFIAGGAGITPFIAILRHLRSAGQLAGNSLLFANRTEGDIILKEELKALLGDACILILDKPVNPTAKGRYIDMQLLYPYINSLAYYYVCGPDKFMEMMITNLKSLGVNDAQIVLEE